MKQRRVKQRETQCLVELQKIETLSPSTINHHLVTRVKKENMNFTDIDGWVEDCCTVLRAEKRFLDKNEQDEFYRTAHLHGCLYLLMDSLRDELLKAPIYGKWCVEILSTYQMYELKDIDLNVMVDQDDLKDILIGIYKAMIADELEDELSPTGRLMRTAKIFHILEVQRQIGLVY